MAKIDKILQKNLEGILGTVAESENIKDYEVLTSESSAQGEGFSSNFFNGEILNKGNGKSINVIIKKSPNVSIDAKFGSDVAFRNETNFYSKIFPELDNFQRKRGVKDTFDNIPRYYVGNTEPNNMFVAMENLKFLGYELLDKKKYLDSEHLQLIFKTYGKFHALSSTYRQINGEEKYEDLIKGITNHIAEISDSPEQIEIMEKSYVSALKFFDAVTEAHILTKLKTVENVKEAVERVQLYKGKHKCLTHGDCWSNNMLFKYKKSGELDNMKLLDFQFPGSTTPVHDLSYIFYSGAAKEDMDKLDYYLEFYHQSLSSFYNELGGNLKEIFSLDTLKDEWKQYGLLGIFLGLQVWAPKLMNKDEILGVLKERDLPKDQYWDLMVKKIEEVQRSPEFKERARNICIHAVEYGII